MIELVQAIGFGLVVLLPLANPLTAVALFLSLSEELNFSERNRQSLQAAIYVFVIMSVAFYAGNLVMNTFGISIPGLRTAGGLIVAFIGFRMLFPPSHSDHLIVASHKKDEIKAQKSANIAFVPLAMPGTAGPGTIAMIISTASALHDNTAFPRWVIIVAPPPTYLSMH